MIESQIPKMRHFFFFIERLQAQLVERFAKVLLLAQRLQVTHIENLRERIGHVEAKVNQIQTSEDQVLFIDHNIRPFTTPDDWKFEPCPVHYDTVSDSPLRSLPKNNQGVINHKGQS
jgi:hypothetical protein